MWVASEEQAWQPGVVSTVSEAHVIVALDSGAMVKLTNVYLYVCLRCDCPTHFPGTALPADDDRLGTRQFVSFSSDFAVSHHGAIGALRNAVHMRRVVHILGGRGREYV